MTDHRKAYLAELSELLRERPGQPRAVVVPRDTPMPSYWFQPGDGGGGCIAGKRS